MLCGSSCKDFYFQIDFLKAHLIVACQRLRIGNASHLFSASFWFSQRFEIFIFKDTSRVRSFVLCFLAFTGEVLFPLSCSPQTPAFTCAHMSTEAPVHGWAPCGGANMSVPKTTEDNRGIITGQTDYTVQCWAGTAHPIDDIKRIL